ncbi:MAG: VanZ family protein [Filimonas sp.]|nr:VanZ family protein [Filimonas sp.]
MSKKSKWIFLAIGWLLVVCFLLCIPGSDLPQSGFFDKIPFFDKWVHIFLFCVLTYLLSMGFSYHKRGTAAIVILILTICYGVAMEFVQKYYIPNRSFDLMDIVADSVGAGIGYLLIVFQSKRWNKTNS